MTTTKTTLPAHFLDATALVLARVEVLLATATKYDTLELTRYKNALVRCRADYEVGLGDEHVPRIRHAAEMVVATRWQGSADADMRLIGLCLESNDYSDLAL